VSIILKVMFFGFQFVALGETESTLYARHYWAYCTSEGWKVSKENSVERESEVIDVTPAPLNSPQIPHDATLDCTRTVDHRLCNGVVEFIFAWCIALGTMHDAAQGDIVSALKSLWLWANSTGEERCHRGRQDFRGGILYNPVCFIFVKLKIIRCDLNMLCGNTVSTVFKSYDNGGCFHSSPKISWYNLRQSFRNVYLFSHDNDSIVT
jgi:hypothetical protein